MESTHNILKDIHDVFTNAPLAFREEVCNECGYSVPTYYRKIRRSPKQGTGHINLSNAHKKAILQQGDKVVKKLSQSLDALRKHIR